MLLDIIIEFIVCFIHKFKCPRKCQIITSYINYEHKGRLNRIVCCCGKTIYRRNICTKSAKKV